MRKKHRIVLFTAIILCVLAVLLSQAYRSVPALGK